MFLHLRQRQWQPWPGALCFLVVCTSVPFLTVQYLNNASRKFLHRKHRCALKRALITFLCWKVKGQASAISCMSHSHKHYLLEMPGRHFITSGTNIHLKSCVNIFWVRTDTQVKYSITGWQRHTTAVQHKVKRCHWNELGQFTCCSSTYSLMKWSVCLVFFLGFKT